MLCHHTPIKGSTDSGVVWACLARASTAQPDLEINSFRTWSAFSSTTMSASQLLVPLHVRYIQSLGEVIFISFSGHFYYFFLLLYARTRMILFTTWLRTCVWMPYTGDSQRYVLWGTKMPWIEKKRLNMWWAAGMRRQVCSGLSPEDANTNVLLRRIWRTPGSRSTPTSNSECYPDSYHKWCPK